MKQEHKEHFLTLRKSYFYLADFTPAREFVLEFKGNLEQGIIAFTIMLPVITLHSYSYSLIKS